MVGFDVNGTWHAIPAPRRKRLMWYAVLNLLLIASMVLLPITFNFAQIHHIYPIRYDEPIGWFADWLWGSVMLTGEYMSPLDEVPPLLILGIIYLVINALFFIGIWFSTPYMKVFTSRLLILATCFWAALFLAISLITLRVPGPVDIIMNLAAVMMIKMFRLLDPTPEEAHELAAWHERLVPMIGQQLESRNVIELRRHLEEFHIKASECGSSKYTSEAERYIACLNKMEILYNEIFDNDTCSLDSLKTRLNMSAEELSFLVMGLSMTFKSTISGNIVTFEKPINRDLFIKTTRRLLDEIRAEAIYKSVTRYQNTMARLPRH